MKRLRWMLEHGSLALPVTLAALLLAATAALQAWAVQPLRARMERLESGSSAAARAALRAPGEDPARQLNTFYKQFRTADALPDHLARLYHVAQAHGITLRQGDYKLLRERDAPLTRYQVVLPVQGPYVKVRRFVAATLDAIPVAALDQISFERKRIDDGVVEAQIRFTFFLPDA